MVLATQNTREAQRQRTAQPTLMTPLMLQSPSGIRHQASGIRHQASGTAMVDRDHPTNEQPFGTAMIPSITSGSSIRLTSITTRRLKLQPVGGQAGKRTSLRLTLGQQHVIDVPGDGDADLSWLAHRQTNLLSRGRLQFSHQQNSPSNSDANERHNPCNTIKRNHQERLS